MSARLLVVDASAVVDLLLANAAGARVAEHVEGHALLAPELLDAEVIAALKGLERGGALSSHRAAEAVSDLLALPVRRWPLRVLVDDVWSLRDQLSTYDAFYVALARAAACPVLTADARWARAGGLGVTVVSVR